MDNLFVIDTQGTANVPVSEATKSYECRVVESTTASRRTVNFDRLKSLGIQIIDDNIGGPSSGNSSRDDRAVPQSCMRNLSTKFVDMEVGNSDRGPWKNKSRRRGKHGRGKKPNDNDSISIVEPPASRRQRQQRPPIIESDGEIDEIFDDFVSNIGQDELKQLLKDADNRSGFLSRNIGGGVDYDCGHSEDQLESPEAVPRGDGIEVDDPFKYEDEIYDLMRDGLSNSDDDDEFPDDIDMDQLPGPDADIRQKGQQPPPHVQRSQNDTSYERDRARGKNTRDMAKLKASDSHKAAAPDFNPHTIIKRLDMLAQTDDMASIWLQPMGKYERQITHLLAREYNVKSKSHGGGLRRTLVLTQTPNSCKPTNSRRVNKILMLHDQGGFIPEQWSGSATQGALRDRGPKGSKGKGGKAKGLAKARGNRGRGNDFKPLPPMDGKMVAEHAPEVGSSNIGHKMLQQMGWQPGQGLGAKEEGRATPVDVMIRAGRRGLGA
ncbi:squalene synthetase-like protein [Coemansia spiralis]|uniref:Squalene synthetase-like protein n=1 Tax=Coemansia spiralis TaxID=417178 RepID=A0A9W8L7G5_9FUNG|nr:squalene synthetase-like protein [Coemansia spiralis]